MILKLAMLGVWMVFVPWGTGYFALGIFRIKELKTGMDVNNRISFGNAFSLGYILTWAVFQLVAVPYIIKAGIFPQIESAFGMISMTLAIAGTVLFFLHLKCGLWKSLILQGKEVLKTGKRKERILSLFLWGVFLAGILFQLAQAYRLAYADGDDAFYIPLSVAATQGDLLYTKDPYTGNPTEVNLRYGLAPFPIWVAFIAAKCSVNAAVAAHSLMPLILIPVTYIIYLEIGKLLCSGIASEGKEKRELLPLFMIFVTLLQIFGNYSIYPASTFLLTRTRQGKAAFGNVIVPFLILLLYKMALEVKEYGKARMQNVLWLMAAMTAGCLCSTMSGFLCGMLVMLTVCLIFLLYRKPSVLLQGILGCMPGIAYALLYLKL